MRVDTHLEQTGKDKKADAEPGNGLEPFLHGFQKYKLCFGVQRAFHGWQDKQRDRRETPHPGCSGKHMKPIREGNGPGWRRRHYGIVGVGVSVGVSVGSSGVFVGVIRDGSIVGGVTRAVRSMVGVGGKQTGKSSS